jgi:adenylate kinase
MVIFFGPAGAGKSVQGQMLAARHGWRWISAGQLLRETKDLDILKTIHDGNMIEDQKMNDIIADALSRAQSIDRVILDGFPRKLTQAEWLIGAQPKHQRSIGLVAVLEVPREELLQRLNLRGRLDDTPEAIEKRLQQYRQEMYPVLSYLTSQNIPVVHVDGTGTVGQVHDRIEAEISAALQLQTETTE